MLSNAMHTYFDEIIYQQYYTLYLFKSTHTYIYNIVIYSQDCIKMSGFLVSVNLLVYSK